MGGVPDDREGARVRPALAPTRRDDPDVAAGNARTAGAPDGRCWGGQDARDHRPDLPVHLVPARLRTERRIPRIFRYVSSPLAHKLSLIDCLQSTTGTPILQTATSPTPRISSSSPRACVTSGRESSIGICSMGLLTCSRITTRSRRTSGSRSGGRSMNYVGANNSRTRSSWRRRP